MSSQCNKLATYDSCVMNLYVLDGISRESDGI